MVVQFLCSLCYAHPKCRHHLSPCNPITIPLTVFSKLGLLFLWLIHSITGSLSPIPLHRFCPSPHLLPSVNHQFILCKYLSSFIKYTTVHSFSQKSNLSMALHRKHTRNIDKIFIEGSTLPFLPLVTENTLLSWDCQCQWWTTLGIRKLSLIHKNKTVFPITFTYCPNLIFTIREKSLLSPPCDNS